MAAVEASGLNPVVADPSTSIPDFLKTSPVFSKFASAYIAFAERREALGLSNPGTVDNIAKEVQRDVFTNNLSFSGLRADLTKAFSVSPLFQVSHALSMGSQMLPPYTFAALYGSPKAFMQANIDSDYSLNGRFNWRWNSALVSKTSVNLAPGQAMCSIENDYTGADFSASIKAMNPSILDGGLTGIYIGSYLQSITPRLALGMEGVWQRAAMSRGPEMLMSYAARYKGDDWVATGQLLAQGSIQASYWKRVSQAVETGIDVNLSFAGLGAMGPGGLMGGPIQKEGTTTFGAKYDFRASSFRAQVDSKGKIGCVLEKRIAPAVAVTFSGEIDHAKNTSKLGLAVSLEQANEDVMAQQDIAMEVPSPPF